MATVESRVWMFHQKAPPEGVKGKLTLTTDGVVFTPAYETAAEILFPLSGIRKAKRVLGSPVLQLHLSVPGSPPLVGFYFVRPPSLEGQRGAGVFKRNHAKRDAALVLVQSNAVKKDEVRNWVRAIREASRGARG